MSTRRILLFAVLLAATIELAQLVIPGRNPTWRDVGTNAVGALLGTLFLRSAPAVIASGARAEWRLVGAIAGGIVAIGVTGIALRPLDGTPPFYGQWAPRLGHLEAWAGRVDFASYGGTAIPDGPWAPTDSVAQLLARDAPLELRAVAGAQPAKLAPIIAIADERQRHLAMLGQSRDDAIVSVARRAQAWRLDAPMQVLPGIFAGLSQGTEFSLTLSDARARPCLRLADRAADRTACATPFATGSLWTLLLYDVAWPRTLTRTLDALTLALLFLPAALLLFRVRRTATLLGVVAIVAGAFGASWGSGLSFPSAFEWSAVGLVLAVGAWRRDRARFPVPSGG